MEPLTFQFLSSQSELPHSLKNNFKINSFTMKVLLNLLLTFIMIWKSVAVNKDSDQVIIRETIRKIEVIDIGLNNVSPF